VPGAGWTLFPCPVRIQHYPLSYPDGVAPGLHPSPRTPRVTWSGREPGNPTEVFAVDPEVGGWERLATGQSDRSRRRRARTPVPETRRDLRPQIRWGAANTLGLQPHPQRVPTHAAELAPTGGLRPRREVRQRYTSNPRKFRQNGQVAAISYYWTHEEPYAQSRFAVRNLSFGSTGPLDAASEGQTGLPPT
jgi:hypothetical protein